MMPSVKIRFLSFPERDAAAFFCAVRPFVRMSYQLKLYVCVVDEPSTLTVTS